VTNNILQAIPEDATDDQVADAQRPDRFVTSNGIVFKLKPVAPLLVLDAQKQIIEPKPPKLKNYAKGEDDDAPLEENPNDPEFLRAHSEYRQKVGEVSNAIFLTRGTEVISVPDDVDKLDDEDWALEVEEFTDIKVPKVGRRRYYCWLKYVALTSMIDFQSLLNKLSALGGVTLESDVADAEASFRTDTSGDAAAGIPPSEEV
jgi:hypothetical protein